MYWHFNLINAYLQKDILFYFIGFKHKLTIQEGIILLNRIKQYLLPYHETAGVKGPWMSVSDCLTGIGGLDEAEALSL